jgi:hypothetical protein
MKLISETEQVHLEIYDAMASSSRLYGLANWHQSAALAGSSYIMTLATCNFGANAIMSLPLKQATRAPALMMTNRC